MALNLILPPVCLLLFLYFVLFYCEEYIYTCTDLWFEALVSPDWILKPGCSSCHKHNAGLFPAKRKVGFEFLVFIMSVLWPPLCDTAEPNTRRLAPIFFIIPESLKWSNVQCVITPPLSHPPLSRNTYIPNLLLHTFANTPRVFLHPIISVSSSTFTSSTRAQGLFLSRAKSRHRPTCRNSSHAAQFGTKCPLYLFLMHSSHFKRK